MSARLLRIATRKSPLALWQANHIRSLLLNHWPDLTIELLPLHTSGDQFLKDRLQAIGGKGLFVKELEEALLDGRADLAVHSMKDVPAECPEGLELTTICTRHTPQDALLSSTHLTLHTLPAGARIGTSSLRRQSQLLRLRPDLHIHPLRGNIHTRINKMQTGEYDAIILAAAGLERMNMQHLISEHLDDSLMLPACGQGALGIECRSNDLALHELLAPLNDPLTTLCVNTERQVNALLGGNCHTPLAVFCQPISDNVLKLRARLATPDGTTCLESTQQGPHTQASELASQCALELTQQGACELLAGLHPA